MHGLPLLVEVAQATPETAAAECLSVFFTAGERPPACLTDPAVVGTGPADGHWQLLGVDDERRRAYYTRLAHSTGFGCEADTGRGVEHRLNRRAPSHSGD